MLFLGVWLSLGESGASLSYNETFTTEDTEVSTRNSASAAVTGARNDN